MASRKQQKEAARAAREQAVSQLKASQSRRRRMMMLYGTLAVAIAAVAVVILVSSSKGGGSAGGVLTQRDGAVDTHAEAQANIKTLLTGIPQQGDIIGNPNAPVTVTEYGDLVCPVCDEFATSTEPQLITDEVRTGKVQLWFRGFETASSFANDSEYTATQVAARAAGQQDKEWDYVLLLYDEQPQTISGKDAEDVSYVNSAYLLNRAQQIPGLNVTEWQNDLGDANLSQDVSADNAAATQLGVKGTPTIFFSGPKGTVQYDKGDTQPSVIPTIQQMQALIKQVS